MSRIHSATPSAAPCALRRSVQLLIATMLPVLAWAGPVDINKADAATIAAIAAESPTTRPRSNCSGWADGMARPSSAALTPR